jgi:hypothetical protein
MPLLPPSLRPYLSDAAANPSIANAPNALAGLGYDSATRAYVDQMGRMGSARQEFWSPVRRAKSTGRVLERFLNGPGNNLTPKLQIARADQAKAFGRSVRRGLGRTAGLGALLGLGALGVNAYRSGLPTTGIEENYLDPRPDTAGAPTAPDVVQQAAAQAGPRQKFTPEESQLMQRFMPSMFRDDPVGVGAKQTGTMDMDVQYPTGYQGRGNAFQTDSVDMGTERPAGFQGIGRPLQTGTMDMNVQYPTGYQGRGNAFQTGVRDMDVQYPTGYQGRGNAFQTGTEDMSGGWLGSLASSFQNTGVRR